LPGQPAAEEFGGDQLPSGGGGEPARPGVGADDGFGAGAHLLGREGLLAVQVVPGEQQGAPFGGVVFEVAGVFGVAEEGGHLVVGEEAAEVFGPAGELPHRRNPGRGGGAGGGPVQDQHQHVPQHGGLVAGSRIQVSRLGMVNLVRPMPKGQLTSVELRGLGGRRRLR
jgi:hypothetical protein